MHRIPPEERDAYARKHVVWLTAVFGFVLVFGVYNDRLLGVLAGVLGLGWIARAFWRARGSGGDG